MTARRAALVTGASYGVGAATALALARGGFDVAVTARKRDNLAATVKTLEAAGATVVAAALDLQSEESIAQASAEIIAALGGLDVLVNNAGVNLRKDAAEVMPQEWHAVMNVNLRGTFFLTQKVGRHLIGAAKGGCIVTIASTHALVGAPERSIYGISKAALIGMTRMLAVEWAAHNIRLNAIAPGRLVSASPSRAHKGADPSYMEAMLERIPLHRLASVEEVASAAAYLASPAKCQNPHKSFENRGGLIRG